MKNWSAVQQEKAVAVKRPVPVISDEDLSNIIYTSGSTGKPKGVMTAHYNCVAATRSIVQYLDNEESDIIYSVLPLSFDYGLYQVLMVPHLAAIRWVLPLP